MPPVKIAIAGDFQDGKSTLINALCGETVAKTGWGIATTSELTEYRIPHTDVYLLDTPGFNATREGDSDMARRGIVQADACIYMLSNCAFTPRMFKDIKDALMLPGGHQKPLIPIINDRDRNNDFISSESIANMKMFGINPLLVGNKMPIIHARKWSKGKHDEEYEQGVAFIKHLLGIEPYRAVSPLERICVFQCEFYQVIDSV